MGILQRLWLHLSLPLSESRYTDLRSPFLRVLCESEYDGYTPPGRSNRHRICFTP